MEVEVDVGGHERHEPRRGAAKRAAYTTTAFTHDAEEADALVQENDRREPRRSRRLRRHAVGDRAGEAPAAAGATAHRARARRDGEIGVGAPL